MNLKIFFSLKNKSYFKANVIGVSVLWVMVNTALIHQMDLSFIFVQIIEPSWKKYVHNIAFPTSVTLHFTNHYPGGRLQGRT